jgi:hypothetical protein
MFQGSKVSRFQGFNVSRFQGFKVSRFQGKIKRPEHSCSGLLPRLYGLVFEPLKPQKL